MKKRPFVMLFLLIVFGVSASDNMLSGLYFSNNISPSFQNEPALNAADYLGKLYKLLSLEMALETSGFDAASAIIEHDNKTSAILGGEKKTPRECNYFWDNGRTRSLTIRENTIKVPHKDKVAIHSVSNTTFERFIRNYGVLSYEQKLAAAIRLEEESAKNSRAETDQKMKEVGTTLVLNLRRKAVSGVGEAVTWSENSSELKVFIRGLMFSVVVDISDDKNANRKKSIDLANTIIQTKFNSKGN